MKKGSYKHLFALSALLTSSAYSLSFNDYTDYKIGENREITVDYIQEMCYHLVKKLVKITNAQIQRRVVRGHF